MKVGSMIEVSNSCDDNDWHEREFIGILVGGDYVCKTIDSYTLYTWMYGREIKESTVYYYRWKRKDSMGYIHITGYMTEEYAGKRGYTIEGHEWTKIESSKTTYEGLV